MIPELKQFIEENNELLNNDIKRFILLCPEYLQQELLDVLHTSKITYPNIVDKILGIFNTYARYEHKCGKQLEQILRSNGANEDDSDMLLGFLSGMTDEQISKTFDEFKQVIKELIRNKDYVSEFTKTLFNL